MFDIVKAIPAFYLYLRHHKKPVHLIVAVIVILFILIIGFHIFQNIMIRIFFSHYTPPPVTVSTSKAQARVWQPQIEAVGNFLATQGVDVNTQAAGEVTKIYFESGQSIKKGQALIDIDDRIEQAILKFNQAHLALAKLNYQRQADLYKRGASAISIVDEAKAKLEQAQADVEKTQVQIQQKHITAPFSGKLGIRKINLGQYISQGQTAIVTLQSHDPLYLEFYLPEQQIKHLYSKQPITFTIEAYPNLRFQGEINAINAKVDPSTHNIQVQATAPNCPADLIKNRAKYSWIKEVKTSDNDITTVACMTQDNQKHKVSNFMLVPGMFAAIKIMERQTQNVIVVPSTAISYSLYGDSVFRIEEEQADKAKKEDKPTLLAKRIFVKTGEQQGNFTVIREGLKPGDTIVSAGEIKLQNGARVTIDNSVQLNANQNTQDLNQ